MTQPAAAPDAVRRHLSRSLLRLGGPSIVVLLIWVGNLWTAHVEDRTFDHGFHVTGRVVTSYGGGDSIPLVYDNPLTGETDAEASRWSADPPAAGDRVVIDVDRDNPDNVVLRGDRYPALPASMMLVIAGAPLLAYGIRRSSLRRTQRLLSAPEPAFLMFGTLSIGGLRRRTVYLNLFPVDARPGDAPLCSVRLLTTEGLPLGGPAFRIEVKGTPRPFARVIARVGDQVLWPRARALGRPVRTVLPAAVAQPPVFRPVDPADVPVAPASSWWPTVRWPLLGLAAAMFVGLVVTAYSIEAWHSARDLEREGVPVVATIGDHTDETLDVTYRLAGSERQHPGQAHVTSPDDWKKDRRYPAVVSPHDPTFVRLLADPYDLTMPLLFAWFPAAALAIWLVRSHLHARRAHHIATTGPWYETDAWSLPHDRLGRALLALRTLLALLALPHDRLGRTLLALAHPDSPDTSCVVRVPSGSWYPIRQRAYVSGVPTPDSTLAVSTSSGTVWCVARPYEGVSSPSAGLQNDLKASSAAPRLAGPDAASKR